MPFLCEYEVADPCPAGFELFQGRGTEGVVSCLRVLSTPISGAAAALACPDRSHLVTITNANSNNLVAFAKRVALGPGTSAPRPTKVWSGAVSAVKDSAVQWLWSDDITPVASLGVASALWSAYTACVLVHGVRSVWRCPCPSVSARVSVPVHARRSCL
jgi:hypothetical protein